MIGLLRTYRTRVTFAAGLFAPLLAAAILVPFRGSFASTAAALVMVLIIVAVAVVGNRSAGFVASVSSALWFVFFLTRPYYRFEISHRLDLETTIAIFVVGIVVTELAAQSRRHWQAAASSTAYVEMIHGVTVLAADSVPITEMIEQANKTLTELLSLRSCRFDSTPSESPPAQILSNGDVAHVGLRWPTGEIGIPGPEAEISATWRGRVVGRFVLTPTPGVAITLEQRITAVVMADVIAAYVVGEHHAM